MNLVYSGRWFIHASTKSNNSDDPDYEYMEQFFKNLMIKNEQFILHILKIVSDDTTFVTLVDEMSLR